MEAQYALSAFILVQSLVEVCGFMHREGTTIHLCIDRAEADDAPHTREAKGERGNSCNTAFLISLLELWIRSTVSWKRLASLRRLRWMGWSGGVIARVVFHETTVQGFDVGPPKQLISPPTNDRNP